MADVFQLDLAEIAERRSHPAQVVEQSVGHADAAFRSFRLQSGGDVHAVAENVAVAIEENVADGDSDARCHRRFSGFFGVGDGQCGLDGLRGADRILGACEFGQYAVAGALDDAPAMLGNQWVEDRLPPSPKAGQRARLVGAHHPAVAGDIQRHDRGQMPFQFLGHYTTCPRILGICPNPSRPGT